MRRQILKLFLVAVVSCLSMVAINPSANAQIIGGQFPIGSEVPFPWDMIEGDWEFDNQDGTFFRFRILSISEEGTRRVWVQHLNTDNNLLAEGAAFVKRNRRVLHARLKTEDGFAQRLRFAAYDDENRWGCDKRTYTIQIRELNAQGEVTKENDYLVNKRRNLR